MLSLTKAYHGDTKRKLDNIYKALSKSLSDHQNNLAGIFAGVDRHEDVVLRGWRRVWLGEVSLGENDLQMSAR